MAVLMLGHLLLLMAPVCSHKSTILYLHMGTATALGTGQLNTWGHRNYSKSIRIWNEFLQSHAICPSMTTSTVFSFLK